MARPSKIQNMSEVERWFREERPYNFMIEQYKEKYHIDTTPAYWSKLRERQGWDRRVTVDRDLIPWHISLEHMQEYPVMMLRAEARRRAGKELKPDTAERLESWLEKLQEKNAVVYYDREMGFFYVPRKDSDADIIRHPASS